MIIWCSGVTERCKCDSQKVTKHMEHDIVIIKCCISFKGPNAGSPKVPADNVLPGDAIKYDVQVSVKKRIFSMSLQVIALLLLFQGVRSVVICHEVFLLFFGFYLLETFSSFQQLCGHLSCFGETPTINSRETQFTAKRHKETYTLSQSIHTLISFVLRNVT